MEGFAIGALIGLALLFLIAHFTYKVSRIAKDKGGDVRWKKLTKEERAEARELRRAQFAAEAANASSYYSSYATSMYSGGSVYFSDSGVANIDGEEYVKASEVAEVKALRQAAKIEMLKVKIKDRQILV